MSTNRYSNFEKRLLAHLLSSPGNVDHTFAKVIRHLGKDSEDERLLSQALNGLEIEGVVSMNTETRIYRVSYSIEKRYLVL